MKIEHFAKINLSLHIQGKREDGYHLLDTVMQEVGVSDTLTMERAHETVLTCNREDVPTDESNLILKAHRALAREYAIGDVAYALEKHIPVAAGMGGGSANCAAALLGLNELFDLGLTKEELAKIGVSLGADVPYFLYGGTCRARGIGEVLDTLPTFAGVYVLLLNDGTHVSTKDVYGAGPEPSDSTIELLIQELRDKKTRLTVHNDLSPIVTKMYPHLQRCADDLVETGADTVLLSGSGATYFGLFRDKTTAQSAYEQLHGKYHWVCLTQTR